MGSLSTMLWPEKARASLSTKLWLLGFVRRGEWQGLAGALANCTVPHSMSLCADSLYADGVRPTTNSNLLIYYQNSEIAVDQVLLYKLGQLHFQSQTLMY